MKLKLNGYNAQLTVRRLIGIMIIVTLIFLFLMLSVLTFESIIKTICCFLYGLTMTLNKFFNFLVSIF